MTHVIDYGNIKVVKIAGGICKDGHGSAVIVIGGLGFPEQVSDDFFERQASELQLALYNTLPSITYSKLKELMNQREE